MPTPRTEILHVRLSPAERDRLRRAAEHEYLDQSTWARRAMLRALEQWESHHLKAVAERPPRR